MADSKQPYFSDSAVNNMLSAVMIGFLIAGITIVLCRMASCEEKRYINPASKVDK